MRVVTYVLALSGLIVAMACGGGNGGPVPPGPGPAPAPLLLQPGFDLFESTGTLDLSLPADFFAPGSEPFEGQVALQGFPTGTRGPFELGTADTVVERQDRLSLGPAPFDQTIPVELVQLRLQSVAPIQVSYGPGITEAWDVDIALDVSKTNDGTVDVHRATETTGTYQGALDAHVMAVFLPVLPPALPRLHEETVSLTLAGNWDTDMPTTWMDYRHEVEGLVPGFVHDATATSTLLDLTLDHADVDPTRPGPAAVDPAATVHPDVGCLARNCQIGAGAAIGEGAVIGPSAIIGDNVIVGDYACVGANAQMAADSQLGAGSALGNAVIVGPRAEIGANTWVGDGAWIDNDSVIGTGCRFLDSVVVNENITIGDDVTLGQAVDIGDLCIVDPDLYLAGGVTIPNGTHVTQSYVTCTDVAGAVSVVPDDGCGTPLVPAWILEHVPGWDGTSHGPPPAQGIEQPIDPISPPPAFSITKLADDIGDDIAPPKNGGKGLPYIPVVWDCDNFAEALRVKLEALGYDATLTVVYDENPNRSWWEFWKPKLINGHCLTDIHTAGGGILFIEPQLPNGSGIGVDLDSDNDGWITYSEGPGSGATDGTKRIEVYDSAQDAEDSGRDLD